MPSTPPPEAELAALNREIEHLEAEQAVLEDQRKKRSQVVASAIRRKWYLKSALKARTFAKKWQQGRVVMLTVLSALVGFVAFMLVGLITGWISAALVCLLVAAGGTAALLYSLFNRPADDLLQAAIAEAASNSNVANAHFKEAYERLTEVKNRLQQLVEERRAKMASGRVQKAALLQRRWKTMSSAEWEDFVVEVCRTLGATVERRGRLDNGAELVIEFGSRRVAAIVRTAREAINSEAVRQAIALREREGCDACAIITNGRFTGAAQDFAPLNDCQLIGRDAFPDFALGQVEW